jgi:S1-C subfamily serine protease
MKPLRITATLLTLAACFSVGDLPRSAAKDLSPEDLYDKVVKSCVYIVTPIGSGFAQGSGSLIDVEQKLVITNYHVVDEEEKVHVQFPIYDKDGGILYDKDTYKERVVKGQSIQGKVLFRDKSRDLAVVKLDKIPIGTPAIPLAKYSPKKGIEVWQIGNAGAVKQVFRVSKGEVSAVENKKFLVGGPGSEPFEVNAKMVTSTAPGNPGDSGGPLFDKRGYQVAVTESGRRGENLVGHFVDVTEVRSLLEQHKITIKELSDEPDPPGKVNPKLKTPPKKEETKKDDPNDEEAAAAKLKRAKLFGSSEDLRTEYVAKLKEIVAKWPTTAAGKEAKKLLDGLK